MLNEPADGLRAELLALKVVSADSGRLRVVCSLLRPCFGNTSGTSTDKTNTVLCVSAEDDRRLLRRLISPEVAQPPDQHCAGVP